ncbi:hypothetical protein F5X99DRAFT_83493 [Biscogniauxia marginata]|nr:hypothetical protein F5X99DRAFT_83493 [Biscogniauxia marginata]
MTKSVCIVGAGPSGLVSAKTLLRDAAPGSFNVTIFDAQPRVGGLWPANKDDNAGLVHPSMITNQSKHTVQFSDLAWQDSVSEFPRAWQVGQYLERYVKEYGISDIRLGHKVVKAELQDGGSWKVQTNSDKGASETNVFDYLLLTTGFFGKPMWPESIPKETDVPIVHSSKYRDIKSLLSGSKSGSKILVVGGQMSGIEIAGTIATHLSSASHSPGEKVIQDPEKYTIHHVIQRPTWVFPLFTSPKADSPAPPFLPCDLPSYNLDRRPKPLTNSQGHISIDAARISNGIFKASLGTDQSEFSPEAKVDGAFLDEQPFMAMSTHYMDFVRSGLIQLQEGKLTAFSGTTAMIGSDNDGETQISDVAAVILATGFDPSPSLSFLPPSVLETISYSPAHPDLPVALAFHSTHHPSLPTLGFAGFYRSPYWGVVEMQARFVARLWGSGELPPPLRAALEDDDSIARTLSLRSDSRCSQFPMGDYVYLMDAFSRALDLPIISHHQEDDDANDQRKTTMNVLTPARYISPLASPAQRAHADRNLRSTRATLAAGLGAGRFVAGAVFRSLLGTWRLEREIHSRLPSHPSGRFVGTARFLLREGTADGREGQQRRASTSGDDGGDGDGDDKGEGRDLDRDRGLEYLYVEDGEFTALGGLSFRATRRYVWRYDEARDRLGVWFARTDDAARADYLFHEVEFIVDPPQEDEEEKSGRDGSGVGWQARASHLCVEDLYDVRYEFGFRAVNLREWKLGYAVRGPKKDYTIDGVYRR